MRLRASALVVVLLVLAGCGGGGDSAADSAELVRFEVSGGELRFELGEPQDSVVSVPRTLLVVRPDGRAMYALAERPGVEFRVDDAELARLKTDLDRIDFDQAADTLSGESEDGRPALSLTHGGTTVELGDAFAAIDHGEGGEVADRLIDLLSDLERIVGDAPGVQEAIDEHLDRRSRTDTGPATGRLGDLSTHEVRDSPTAIGLGLFAAGPASAAVELRGGRPDRPR